jgi:predicted RNA-binding Zn-ribbon protein involved in translation (DUF1610 family)
MITMTEIVIETNQITKQFKCLNCGNVFTYNGPPGKNLPITCSSCGTKGKVTIPGDTQKHNDSAIEITYLRKVFGDLAAVDDVSFRRVLSVATDAWVHADFCAFPAVDICDNRATKGDGVRC